jgi:4'-phosphopantetheinyl transferase
MRVLLAGCIGRAPSAVDIEDGPVGKPELRPVPGSERLQFNLSHSHGVGVLAVAMEDEVGIDVERIRPLPDALAIAEQFFADGEILALRAAADEARSETFFRYWTRKEAVVKSFGRGLTHPLDGFELSSDGLSPERVMVSGEDPSSARWVLPLTPPYPGFVAAVATACVATDGVTTAGTLPQIHSSHAPEGVFPRR